MRKFSLNDFQVITAAADGVSVVFWLKPKKLYSRLTRHLTRRVTTDRKEVTIEKSKSQIVQQACIEFSY